jgi:hypothetical protein
VLLPLDKGRPGDDAPTFVVRLTYLQPIDAWIDNPRAHVTFPALDLPVSRTGVELYHSPRYKVALEPGAFRLESDPGVFAEALRAAQRGNAAGAGTGAALSGGVRPNTPPVAAAPPPVGAVVDERAATAPQDNLKTLIDRYRDEGGGRTVRGALPVEVAFPSLGPSLFMASELTAEAASPAIDLAIRRVK